MVGRLAEVSALGGEPAVLGVLAEYRAAVARHASPVGAMEALSWGGTIPLYCGAPHDTR